MTTAVADPVDALAERLATAMERVGQRSYGYVTGFKHDAAGSPISIGFSHGPGGNLTYPGVDQDVFHTVVGGQGLLGQLPVRPSVYTNPLFEVITGVGADSGSEKDEPCDDAVSAGLATSGILTSVFGRYERQTPELEINRIGQLNDRADPMDLRLVGSPMSDQLGGLFGARNPAVPGDVLRSEISRKMWELNTSLHNLLSQQLYSGSPANNSAAGGYKEWTGLDLLINTGHRDAINNAALPSVDSLVVDFNYQNVEDSGPDIVDALTWMYFTRRDLAIRTGLNPVRWVFAMRPELFRVLTSVWPCAYFTYQCNLSANDQARVNIDGTAQSRMRDDMWNGRYLLIDGERVEVILDDGIAQGTSTTNGNVGEAEFSSNIYIIPMSILGGRAVTYIEHFDYNNTDLQAALREGMALARVDGPWLTVPKQKNYCIQWQTKIEPRLVLRTPWLAARLNNVVASPLLRTRSPFPDDPYFVGGGATSRPGPSYYSMWQS